VKCWHLWVVVQTVGQSATFTPHLAGISLPLQLLTWEGAQFPPPLSKAKALTPAGTVGTELPHNQTPDPPAAYGLMLAFAFLLVFLGFGTVLTPTFFKTRSLCLKGHWLHFMHHSCAFVAGSVQVPSGCTEVANTFEAGVLSLTFPQRQSLPVSHRGRQLADLS
jgi:hypothetical protein